MFLMTLFDTFSFYFEDFAKRKGESSLSKKESKFQSDLKEELFGMFEGCIITKLDSGDIQGIPDLLILYNDKWATLECKKHEKARHRPNQDYYVDLMNNMSFSAFIYPENKEEILNGLVHFFTA